MKNKSRKIFAPFNSCFIWASARDKTILAIFFAWVIAATATAQQIDYDMVSHYTNDNGLPQNSINAIAQDANGFIWMTTFGGLVRYDGNTLRVYNPGNTPAMRTNSFYTLSLNHKTLEITRSGFSDTTSTLSWG